MVDKNVEKHVNMIGLSGPAAVAASYANLENYVRELVRICIVKQDMQGDIATAIAEMHDRVARLLDDVVREYGIDTMEVAATYAATALEAGLIYPGQELESFVRRTAGAVRTTTRSLIKSGGSIS